MMTGERPLVTLYSFETDVIDPRRLSHMSSQLTVKRHKSNNSASTVALQCVPPPPHLWY